MKIDWIRVEDKIPEFPLHSHDGATDRVLVWCDNYYGGGIYIGYVEYSEDGISWIIDGDTYKYRKVTHWAGLGNGPHEND